MPNIPLSATILSLAKKRRRRIGIAILKADQEIIGSLKRASEVAEVVVYGQSIEGFENVAPSPPTPLRQGEGGRRPGEGLEVGVQMIRDYKEGKIDRLVRGQVDDLSMVEEAKELFGIDPKERRVDIVLMRDACGREFFLTGVSNPDLQTLEEKIRVSTESAKWIKETFGIDPKIAVMATCRPGSYGKDPVMSQTFDEAEAVVKHLQSLGYYAENVHIELERAVETANLIVPARGTIGNQIFRAVIYLGGGKNLACPTYFPGKLIYEDNSRNEQDWYPHIVFAAALANMR